VMMSDSSRRQPLEVNIPRGSERKLSYPTGLRPVTLLAAPPGYPIVSPRQRSSCAEVRHASGGHPTSHYFSALEAPAYACRESTPTHHRRPAEPAPEIRKRVPARH
jgi:hypothetical protein